MRALLYCRVSDDRAEGRSVREQEAELRALCERHGWTVAHVISDSLGASTYSRGTRTGWAEVQRLIAAGEADLLVTWENSRAARNLADYSELRDLCAKHGVQWVYSGRTHDLSNPDDRFTSGLDALLSEKETSIISQRVRRAARADAAAGRPHGGRVLYGYRRVYNARTGRLEDLEPEPEHAAIVRRIYDASEQGQGMDSIARGLNAEGIPNPSGAQWAGLGVKRVLRNPGYAGRRVHKGEVVGPATWPPLIDPDRFDRLQALIDARRIQRRPNHAWMLTGVTRCGVCAGKVGVKRSSRRPKYTCLDRFCVARSADDMHEFIGRLIIGRVDSLGEPGDDPVTDDVAAVQAQIAELEERLERTTLEAAKGEMSIRMAVGMEKAITADLVALRAELRRLVVPRQFDPPTGDAAEWWDELDMAGQREVVNALIDLIVIHRTGRGARTFDPTRVEVTWR